MDFYKLFEIFFPKEHLQVVVYETIKVVADVLQNMFLKISYISQENTYASASFLKFCYEIYESFKKTFFKKKNISSSCYWII